MCMSHFEAMCFGSYYSLLGAHDECGKGEALMPFVLVQGLMGQQEAVVQHVQGLQEGRVDLHLPQ